MGDRNSLPTTIKKLMRELKDGNIELPSIQRNFVWKPDQIENLWDSILRGFTIGAFTVTGREGQWEILDGQQRLTAIALAFDDESGFADRVLKASCGEFQIFVDLIKPREHDEDAGDEDNRKYIFRVITRAHPWGYDLLDNTKRLEAHKIGQALELYKKERKLIEKDQEYYEADLRRLYPYSAVCPVPLRFFVTTTSPEEAQKKITQWREAVGLEGLEANPAWPENGSEADRYKEKYYRVSEVKPPQYDPPQYYTIIEDIWWSVREVLERKNVIAWLWPQILEEKSDDVEQMFMRINRGGTNISGEELNYSLLKSYITAQQENHDTSRNIDPERIQEIEDACKNIIQPARFITIAFRLFGWYKKNSSSLAASASIDLQRVKTKDFGGGLAGFEKFLNKYFLGKPNKYLQTYKELLKYDEKTNPDGLPYVTFLDFAKQAPELVFMLLYRLIMGDELVVCKKQVLSVMTALLFFGKHKDERNYQKLLRRIWPAVRTLKSDAFWGADTMARALHIEGEERINGEPVIYAPDDLPDDLREWKRKKGSVAYKNIMEQKHFLLYAQRRYLDRWFRDELFDLDDTNIPYDYDHILPQSWIQGKGKQKIMPELRDKAVYGSIGNLRAWPYSLNRKDQDNSLQKKFNPLEDCAKKELEFWNDECPSYFRCSSPDLLKEKLLKASLCDDEEEDFWETNNIDDKKQLRRDRSLQKAAFKAILKRNTYIYTKWFNTLQVKYINPIAMDDDFNGFLDKCFKHYSIIDEKNNPFDGKDKDKVDDYAFFKKPEFLLGINSEWICDEYNFELIVIIDKASRKKLQKKAEEAGWSAWDDGTTFSFCKYYTLIAVSDEAKRGMLRVMFKDIKELFGTGRAEEFKGCLKRKFADAV